MAPDQPPLVFKQHPDEAAISTFRRDRVVLETAMIETPRLLLRPYALHDFDAYFAFVGDPAFADILGGNPMSREDAWHRMLRYAGHWALFGYGLFAIFERETGRHVGETGLADFHRGLGDQFDAAPEAAWIIAKDRHGIGYAVEAAGAAHDWFDAAIGTMRTVCIIQPDNAASLRLADKLGFTIFGSADYRQKAFAMLERCTPLGGIRSEDGR